MATVTIGLLDTSVMARVLTIESDGSRFIAFDVSDVTIVIGGRDAECADRARKMAAALIVAADEIDAALKERDGIRAVDALQKAGQ